MTFTSDKIVHSKISPPASGRSVPAGFTLLELMLALALTGLILMAISMAVDLHLRSLEKRRADLEHSQLARSVLRLIADDIRGCIQYYEQDLSSVEKMLGDTTSAAVGEVLPDELAGEMLPDDSELDAALEEEPSENTQDLAGAAQVSTMPGIYGNQYELQIDVSRLPRVDQYQNLLPENSATTLTDIPSDVKTVTYFVQTSEMGVTSMPLDAMSSDLSLASDPSTNTGLVRRELDRAITQWAVNYGNATGLQQTGDVIAPEVIGIEFMYFDGLEWRTEWDSDTEGALPVAIEVLLMMQPFDGSPAPGDVSLAALDPLAAGNLRFYRMVVRLPTGQPIEESSAELGMGL